MKDLYKVPTVAVLLCTYNGEKYLSELIDSVLRQENVITTIIIHDDGSKDGTVNIIKRYISDYPDIIRFLEDNEHCGPGNSFMELLYRTSGYDYYAFADQDDIWLPSKLSVAIDKIGNFEKPALYCSNQIIYYDDSDKKRNESCLLRYTTAPGYSLINAIFSNKISGCTMVFNSLLRDIISNPNARPSKELIQVRMHDVWVLSVANLLGTVYYDQNSYIKYRIHEDNTVGIKDDEISIFRRLKFWMKAILLYHEKSRIEKHYREETAKQLIESFKDFKQTFPENFNKLETLAYYRCSKHGKKNLLNNKDIFKESQERAFSYKIKVVFELI